jgi:hypothetical protein
MKKILAVLMLAMVFASCNDSIEFHYSVRNNCKNAIIVEFRTMDSDTTSMNIKSGKSQELATYTEDSPKDAKGLSYFRYLIVIKGNDTSKVDYIHNPSLWLVEEEEEWGNNWNYVTLIIDSSAFEN